MIRIFVKLLFWHAKALFTTKVRNNTKLKKNNTNLAGNYMFKVNNRNTRTRCEICSKLTIKTPERR